MLITESVTASVLSIQINKSVFASNTQSLSIHYPQVNLTASQFNFVIELVRSQCNLHQQLGTTPH